MTIYKNEFENKISIIWEFEDECDYYLIKVYVNIDERKVLMIEEKKEPNTHFFSIDRFGPNEHIFVVEAYQEDIMVDRIDINGSSIKNECKTIEFGSYYKEFADTIRYPLEWDVLEEKDGKALIITHNIIDCKPFDIDSSNNYEKSSIRKWLNDVFYNSVFNEEQKEKIIVTLVDNSLSSTGDVENRFICNDTNDSIFLLSVKEAQKYYVDNNARQARGTRYAKMNGLYVDKKNEKETSMWWLRSPHSDDFLPGAHYVYDDGNIYRRNGDYTYIGIRPACWIKL